MRLPLLATAALCASSLAASATTIDFKGVQDYTPLTTYTENGFSVSSNEGIWLFNGYLGNPAGSIYADRAGSLLGSILVSDGGNAFTFSSVDLANDVAIANYTIEGFSGSELEFSIADTLPTDPLGHSVFRTYDSDYENTAITSLLIRESYGGGTPDYAIYNDVNVDNIVVNAYTAPSAAITPEPSSVALLGTGLLGLTGLMRKRLVARP